MKQWVISSVLMLASLISFASCIDDNDEKCGVKEGEPVEAKLSIAATEFEKIQTKVADDYISDLYVMVFDKSGDLLTHQYYSGLTGLSGDITISTTSGERYIYGIANLSTSSLSIDASTLNNITSVSALKSMLLSLSNNTVGNADGKYLMSGFWCENNTDETAEACLINTNGAVTSLSGTTGSIKLKRLQSQITFNVSYGENAASFTITEVNLRKIPSSSKLTEDGTTSVTSGYFNVEKLATNAGNKSFTFYMLENKQTAKGSPSTYNDRENVSSGNWQYAPDNSTYVEIKGHYVGTADRYTSGAISGTSKVDANVTYYVHLGYVNDDLSDFSSLRNKNYTYNITVTGVNSLVAEVEVSGDKYDRGDGDIYYADGDNVITLDAHYSQFVMTYTYEQLGKAGLDFSVLVKSNNTSGFQNADHGWLSFVQNPSGVTKVVSYPGSTSSKLLNTDEFLAALKDFKNDASNAGKTIYFTCYVNEYYPIGTDTNWKRYVNQDDRYAQVICNTKSGNGSTLIDAAYVIRQHPILSFYNLDNVNTAWGIEWENETTNTMTISGQTIEIGLPYGNPAGTTGSSSADGRANMLSELGSSPSWYSTSTSTPSSQLAYRSYSSDLQKAYAACMQRNRDENGNGVIDNNEVKWYLPALNQYLDMSIGMNILPQDVQLYSNSDYNTTFNENNSTYWMFMHYVSNTNKNVFWGEEGGPYSSYGGSGDGKISKTSSVPNGERQFRCIRNVGAINSFDDFVSYSTSNKVVSLSKVNPQALRSDYLNKGELQKHDERSVYSRPYAQFQIAKNTCGTETASYKFVGWGKGSYALSDANGYYCTSNAYGKLNSGTAGSYIYIGTGGGLYYVTSFYSYYYGRGSSYSIYSMADKNGYYISYSNKTDGAGTWKKGTANTYYNVGSGNGFYDIDYTLSGSDASYGWETVNSTANTNGTSVCSYYYENSDKSDLGTWRLPNMRELLIIVNKANFTGQSIMSRTYYSFYGTGFLSPGNSVSREGYAYNTSVVYLIDPGNTKFNIRCVRDIQ